MKNILAYIFFHIWALLAAVTSLILSSAFLLVSYIAPVKGKSVMFFFYRFWGKAMVYLSLSRVSVIGEENVPRNEALVIISNHQSMFDIFLGIGFYPMYFLFFSKKEVFKVPLIGRIMTFLGFIGVDRANPRAAGKALLETVRKVKKGSSILIYPEGTRSYNAEKFLDFKPGTLIIARQSGAPILPVLIYGSSLVMPESRKRYIWPKHILIKILPPIHSDSPLHPSSAGGDDDKEEKILVNLKDYMQDEYRKMIPRK
jgi:1-acyl-sn-glycerol-3-phosphate acyltransferase